MANLAISSVCNLKCDYCFTTDHFNGSAAIPAFMAISDFELCLDFLDRSGVDQVRLLGGEPTLHPQFVELIELARRRNKSILVFTNGLMSEEVLSCLEKLPATECNVLVNASSLPDGSRVAAARQRTTIQRLGERVTVGLNIDRSDFQPEFLLRLIIEARCQPAIRLGIAQPCLSGRNQYIHPKQYCFVGARIARFAHLAAKDGVRLEFDCGFVRCMFSDTDLQVLVDSGADVGWRCNPILDVDTACQVIHCYPLARLGSLPLTPELDATSLRSAFAARTRPYRQAGIFPQCSTCPFKTSGECTGGCLSAAMRRFRHTPFRLSVSLSEVAQ